jgi:diaminopimelate decarboxylase
MMKVLGKSKQGHRVLLVTEYEWEIITEAMFEYEEVCVEGDAKTALRDIKRVNNRLCKAVTQFESLEKFTDLKKLNQKGEES